MCSGNEVVIDFWSNVGQRRVLWQRSCYRFLVKCRSTSCALATKLSSILVKYDTMPANFAVEIFQISNT